MTLTEARIAAKMSGADLARALDISRQHANDLEKGRRAPSAALAVRIVRLFPTVDLVGLLKQENAA